MTRLTILLWCWRGHAPYHGHHVAALARQLRAHLHLPYRVVLLTDDVNEHKAEALGVDAIEEVPGEPKNAPLGRGQTNCWRRLAIFSPAYGEHFGTEFIMSLDLDALVLDGFTQLVERAMSVDFSILRGSLKCPYNGGMYCLRVGKHADVFSTFDWRVSPGECIATKWVGSDQVWIGLRVKNALTFGPEDGAYFRGQYMMATKEDRARACLITFPGHKKPWSKTTKREAPQLHAMYRKWA